MVSTPTVSIPGRGTALTRVARAWTAGAYPRAVLALLFGVLLALVGLENAAPTTGRVGPFRVELVARLARPGVTTLAFPPFGEVSAATHRRLPVELRLTLAGVDLPALQEWVGENASADVAWSRATGSLRPLIRLFLLRTALLTTVLGAAGGYLVGRRARDAASGALAACLTVGLLAGGVAIQFDQRAFQRPRYEGALEAAPWVVGLLEKSWDKVGDLGTQIEAVARNLSGLSDQLESLAPTTPAPRDLRLLHVSDLHNNPLGVKFITEAVRTFGVDAVVDTGDLTDWGTPLEAGFVRDLAALHVPYFFVPGNHDSPQLLKTLRRQPRLRVLDGRPVKFRGLTLWGVADPSSGRNDPEVAPPDELRALGRTLAEEVEAWPAPPDLIAVHNPILAESLAGRAPVILHGHDHRLKVREVDGSVLIDAGSTGAAGVRGLSEQGETPYSMALLYFSKTPEGYRLRALDTLEVRGRSGGFALNRILVGDGGNAGTPGEPLMKAPGARPAPTGR